MNGRPDAVVAVAVVSLVALAGCSGALPGGTAASNPGGGHVNVYLSDDPGVTSTFDRVNVTVTRVVLKRAHGCRHCRRGTGNANGTRRKRVVRDVPNATVDLTDYRGANATALARGLDVPNGTYRSVSIRVRNVTAVRNDTRVPVRVPHGRLRVRERFTVGDGDDVGFVVDAAVRDTHRGYVLRPVANASGTDVRVRTCDTHGGRRNGGKRDGKNCTCRCGG